MRSIIVLVYLLLSSIVLLGQTGVSWNLNEIEIAKRQFNLGKKEYVEAINKLFGKSNTILTKKDLLTVTIKKNNYVSGSLNDYVSMATYYWPNPKTKTGLPYIIRDGKKNPEVNQIPDQTLFYEFCDRVKFLSLSSYFSNDRKYGNKAVELLNCWFLDPNTLMNPNLNHSQFIKGKNTGRAEGIIDGRFLVNVIDGVILLKKNNYLNDNQYDGIKKWFERYLSWLKSSEIGQKGKNLKNNIGTAYYLQIIAIQSFLGKENELRQYSNNELMTLFNNQFKVTGAQPHELRRKSPVVYSLANLNYWAQIKNILTLKGLNNFAPKQAIIDNAIKSLEGKGNTSNRAVFRFIDKSLSSKNLKKSILKSEEKKLNVDSWDDLVSSLTF